jgi:hypothetical protein
MDDQIGEFVNRYISEMCSDASDDTQAWLFLEELIESEPDTAWRVVTRLVMQSPDTYVHRIGAGPLETLLVDRPEFFGRAVGLAKIDTKFREALRYVRGVEIPAEWHEAYEQLWQGERSL